MDDVGTTQQLNTALVRMEQGFKVTKKAGSQTHDPRGEVRMPGRALLPEELTPTKGAARPLGDKVRLTGKPDCRTSAGPAATSVDFQGNTVDTQRLSCMATQLVAAHWTTDTRF